MLVTTQNSRWGRGIVAAWLALLLCFASLAPIAAQSFNTSSAGMACCKTKGQCCCRKHPGLRGETTPAITAAGCFNCANMAANGVGSMGYAPNRSQVLTVAIEVNGKVPAAKVIPRARILAHSLLQRPPPTLAA